MDMGSAIVIESNSKTKYYVEKENEFYSSPQFIQAVNEKTPLSAQDLIQEDHNQIVETLDFVCKGRMDLTEETDLMLKILKNTKTIDNAIH